MITLLSPAKSLNLDPCEVDDTSSVRLSKQTQTLVNVLRKKSPDDLKQLFSVSDQIAELNATRYQSFSFDDDDNAKQSILAFNVAVYNGVDVSSFSGQNFNFAQQHLRILSGLYGLLRPLDLIQPYRLEMGTKLIVGQAKHLYDFWGDQIVGVLHEDLKSQGDDVLLNLASKEYFKSVDRKSLKANIVNVDFLDEKNGKFKTIAFYAKKARGLMSRFVIKNEINDPRDLVTFNEDGYLFDNQLSTETHLVFKREAQ